MFYVNCRARNLKGLHLLSFIFKSVPQLTGIGMVGSTCLWIPLPLHINIDVIVIEVIHSLSYALSAPNVPNYQATWWIVSLPNMGLGATNDNLVYSVFNQNKH